MLAELLKELMQEQADCGTGMPYSVDPAVVNLESSDL